MTLIILLTLVAGIVIISLAGWKLRDWIDSDPPPAADPKLAEPTAQALRQGWQVLEGGK
jgi:hypothetical protein